MTPLLNNFPQKMLFVLYLNSRLVSQILCMHMIWNSLILTNVPLYL